MAEEVPPIQNKKLLLVALVLAALVVVMYQVHIWRIKDEAKGETLKLVRLVRDMDKGERISDRDIEPYEVRGDFVRGLVNVVKWENAKDSVGSQLNQPVLKDHWLLWSHVTTDEEKNRPSKLIGKGMVGVTLQLDPQRSPGDILRVGDCVNVLGMMSLNNQPLNAMRVIEGVTVLAVGGRGIQEKETRGGPSKFINEGMQSFRTVTIAVEKNVSLQLANVLSHVTGSVWLEVRSPSDPPIERAQVNPLLGSLSASPNSGGAEEETE